MRLLFALPLLGLSACAQYRAAAPAQHPDVSAWARDREPVTLVFAGRPQVPARALRLGADTTAFFHVRLGREVRVPTADLAAVVWRDRDRGRWLGAAAGAAGGLAVGGLMALPVNAATGDLPAGERVGLALGLAVSGALVGGALGARIGLPTGYTFVR